MSPDSLTNPIDVLMERASRELFETRYHDAADTCMWALRQAREADDFARMARICMPLQEARRWIRQTAMDTGIVRVVSSASDLGTGIDAGCYLIQPPLVGVDARQFRARAWEAGVAVFVLCREPLTRDGHWPIVGVGEQVVRVRVDPPSAASPLEPGQTSPAGDRIDGPIDIAWFSEAAEELGDRAIVDASASGEASDPPAWAVDDLLDRLEAAPEHEKLLQALSRACRAAVGTTTPSDRRRRRGLDDPYSF